MNLDRMNDFQKAAALLEELFQCLSVEKEKDVKNIVHFYEYTLEHIYLLSSKINNLEDKDLYFGLIQKASQVDKLISRIIFK